MRPFTAPTIYFSKVFKELASKTGLEPAMEANQEPHWHCGRSPRVYQFRHFDAHYTIPENPKSKNWCQLPESNGGPSALQTDALPTELNWH